MEDLRIGATHAPVKVVAPNMIACLPSMFIQPHLIHPSTLDALLQLAVPLFSRHCFSGSVMTVAIKEVIVSANIVNKAGKELLICASLNAHGQRSAENEMLAFQVNERSELIPAASVHRGELRATG